MISSLMIHDNDSDRRRLEPATSLCLKVAAISSVLMVSKAKQRGVRKN